MHVCVCASHFKLIANKECLDSSNGVVVQVVVVFHTSSNSSSGSSSSSSSSSSSGSSNSPDFKTDNRSCRIASPS